MTNQKLRNLLETLHKEIEKTKSVDDKGRELLQGLDADIRALLDRSQPNESILDKLKDTIDHFEVTHPNLTQALSEALSILSNAGI